MQAKVKFRIGDTVYHKTLDLGRGKVRFFYRAEVLVAFEKAVPTRFPKEELCRVRATSGLSAGCPGATRCLLAPGATGTT